MIGSTARTAALGAAAAAALAAGGLLAAPAQATTVPACGNSSLAVSATGEQGATGHANFVLLFRNRTRSSCSLFGYPGLDALNSAGTAIAHARRTLVGFTGGSRHGLRTIVVAPGRYASADVEWLNFNPTTTGSCRFSHSVATTPANTTHTVHLARSVSICRLQVHPTVAGTSGNG
jgi:Protein of unknown function (DUF4232)